MRRHAFAIASIVTTLALPALAVSEEVDGGVQPEQWGSERVLGGHVFEYPTLTETAFMASTLNFQVLAGANAQRTTAADGVSQTSVHQITPVLNLDLTLHVADPVSINFGLIGGAAAGISAGALVLKGETLTYAFTTGVSLRLFRDEQSATQMALHADFLLASGSTVNLRSLVEVLQGDSGITIGDIVNASLGDVLLTPFTTYQGGASAALAHAFARWLSLQSSLGVKVSGVTSSPYDIAAQVRQNQSQVVLTPAAAVALEFDGNPFRIPLALMFEYRLSISWDFADSTTTNSWGNGFDLGIFYSGRPDLQAGIIFLAFIGIPPIGVTGPTTPGSSQNGYGSLLTMRYVW